MVSGVFVLANLVGETQDDPEGPEDLLLFFQVVIRPVRQREGLSWRQSPPSSIHSHDNVNGSLLCEKQA